MADKAVTGGHDEMMIGIELIRLGTTFESKSMETYGKELLVSYLEKLLDHICDTSVTEREKNIRFKAYTDFPKQFCAAIRNAYDTERPAKPVQGILADFTFAARMHLFKDKEFETFITTNQIPEFGNLVLAAQISGGISGAFEGNITFNMWKQWQLDPSNALY